MWSSVDSEDGADSSRHTRRKNKLRQQQVGKMRHQCRSHVGASEFISSILVLFYLVRFYSSRDGLPTRRVDQLIMGSVGFWLDLVFQRQHEAWVMQTRFKIKLDVRDFGKKEKLQTDTKKRTGWNMSLIMMIVTLNRWRAVLKNKVFFFSGNIFINFNQPTGTLSGHTHRT